MSEEHQHAGPEREQPAAPAPRPNRPGSEPRWLTAALLAAVALFLYAVSSMLAPFVIAAVLAYLLNPVVVWIEQHTRVVRPVAVAAFLLALVALLVTGAWLVEPTLVRETNELVKDAPTIINNLMIQLFGAERIEVFGQTIDARAINGYIQRGITDALGAPGGALHAATVLVETVLRIFLVLVLLVYFLLNPRPFGALVLRMFSPEQRATVGAVGADIHSVLGRYVRGLVFLVLLMSTATWIGLTFVFHVPYSLPLAITTGFLEIIPFLGPVAAGAVACAVAFSAGGPQLTLGVALFYFVLRQMEDQLVMPVVIGRAVELHPAINIFAVLAGSALWGVLGALLAIPAAAAIKVAFVHFRPD